MQRRNFLKSLALSPLLGTPLLSGCDLGALRSLVRDESDRKPDYLLDVEGDIYGLKEHMKVLTNEVFSRNQEDILNLVVLGDSGKGDQNQKKVADYIALYHQIFPVDAMIHTGDIIYPNGITSPDDPQAQTHFEQVYLRPDLRRADHTPVPMYAVLGNHDHYGDADAMIEFASHHSQVLHLPARYFSINTSSLGMSGPETEIFFLDSYPFIKNRYSLEQMAWLDSALSASKAERKILVSHHPLRVYGTYQDSKFMRDTIEVLAQEYGVDICLAGHDHHLQIQRGSNGITYMVSGGGGGGLRASGVGADSIFSAAHFGAIAVQISTSNIRYIPLMQINEQSYPEYHYYEESLS